MKKPSLLLAIISELLSIFALLIPWVDVSFFKAGNPNALVYRIYVTPIIFWTSFLSLSLFVLTTSICILILIGVIKKKDKYIFYSSVTMFLTILYFIAYVGTFLTRQVRQIAIHLANTLECQISATIVVSLGPIVAILSSILAATVIIIEYI